MPKNTVSILLESLGHSKLESKEHDQWLLVAERLMSDEDIEGAAVAYIEAIECDKSSKNAHYGLYLAYIAQGETIAAQDIYGCIEDLVGINHHTIESLILNYQRLLHNPLYHNSRDLLSYIQEQDDCFMSTTGEVSLVEEMN